MRPQILAMMTLALIFVVSCTEKKSTDSSAVTTTMTAEQLVARGKAVYETSCSACHGVDAKQDGATGPAIADSSLELLTARVLRGDYPAGYSSKRPTKIMIALPHLEKEIPAIFAYLSSLKP